MNILFVNYHDFSSNSAIHIFNLANHLKDLAVETGVCVPRSKQSVELIGEAKFNVYDFHDLFKGKIKFRNGLGPDLIHAWTPREIVRKYTLQLREVYACPYIIHLEDNEEAILNSKYHVEMDRWRSLPARVVNRIIDHEDSHPFKYKEFLGSASGVTVIMDRLMEFKPEHVPGIVFWPGYEDDLFQPIEESAELKAKLGIPANSFVVVYTGNVHHSNADEVYSLYLAVAALNRLGISVKLVRTGRNFIDIMDSALSNYRECFIELGFVKREKLPQILSLADVLVQPGSSNEFNNYRFPAKLPEFFAMGKPVILPETNIGNYLTDGVNCLMLKNGDAIEIAEKLKYVFDNKQSCNAIGAKGREFALKHFNWSASARKLKDFYMEVLQRKEQ